MGLYKPGTITYSISGENNWIAPSGVYSVTVELWGGGGAGGYDYYTTHGGSGAQGPAILTW